MPHGHALEKLWHVVGGMGFDVDTLLTALGTHERFAELSELVRAHRAAIGAAFLECVDDERVDADELPEPVREHLRSRLPVLLGPWADEWSLWGLRARATDPWWSAFSDHPPLRLLHCLELDVGEAHSLASLAPLEPQVLVVVGTRLHDLSSLSGMRLTRLSVSHTSVTTLEALEACDDLESVRASHTNLTDLDPLAARERLVFLSVAHTRVRSVTPLASCHALEKLFLNDTRVQDVSALASLGQLRELNLANTLVADLTPLHPLTGLRRLSLSEGTVSKADLKRTRRALPRCKIELYRSARSI